MYLPIQPQFTNAQGWLAASKAVQDLGGEAHNVIVDIADPLSETGTDAAIVREVDNFLRDHHHNALSSVANTIFPKSLYERHGPDAFYDVYRDRVLPRIKTMTRDWGRYFERLTMWKKIEGNQVRVINPLDDLVQFMQSQMRSNRTYRNVYEMTVYDPTRDARKVSNRQCLSFLSFKLTHEKKVNLTVMYRNHAYVSRGLGNFIGLGRLLAFVAHESGTGLGSLTCISTHAEIDCGTKRRDSSVMGWTRSEANALLDRCVSINESAEAA